MDPLGIAARVVFTSLVLLALVRASGKPSIAQAGTFEFVIAVIIGDLVDDMIWAEVKPDEFLAAAVTLFAMHWLVEYGNYWAGARRTKAKS